MLCASARYFSVPPPSYSTAASTRERAAVRKYEPPERDHHSPCHCCRKGSRAIGLGHLTSETPHGIVGVVGGPFFQSALDHSFRSSPGS